MVHVGSAAVTRDLGYSDVAAIKPVKARDLLRRLVTALNAARQRDVDRAIGRFIRNSGGKLTDDIERQIERRFLSTF